MDLLYHKPARDSQVGERILAIQKFINRSEIAGGNFFERGRDFFQIFFRRPQMFYVYFFAGLYQFFNVADNGVAHQLARLRDFRDGFFLQ